MSVNVDQNRRLIDAATGHDPEVGLTAVVALRQLVEVLEELQVDNARALTATTAIAAICVAADLTVLGILTTHLATGQQ